MVECRPEGNHSAKTYLVNNTSVEINIGQYSQSQKSGEVYILKPKHNISVVGNGGRGKSAGYSLATEISFYDSVVVVFNNADSAVHYRYNTTGNNPKAIKSSDQRSLYNRDAYSKRIVNEDKHTQSTEYTYTFTEKDYLNAQKQ